jgi:tripartite-type tricarboxylate transporter receptor subunit TctC
MLRAARAALTILVFAAVPLAGGAHAQPYPNHPVRILVGFAAGSGPDVVARAVAIQLGTDLGQNFFIENRTGANGTIATKVLATSDPDGYTLLYTSNSIAPTPFVYKNLPYDIFRDIVPIATSGILDGLLVLVKASSPIHTVPELIAYAKDHRVLYGSPGIGNGLHLAAEMFNKTAGIKMEHIPFKGASEVLTALLSGNVDMMFITPTSALPLVKDGKLRAIAFTGTKPFAELPDLPLITSSVPTYPPTGSWGIFFAPGKTPPDIIDKLNAAIRHALHVPTVARVVGASGYVPDERSPAQTAEFFRKEVAAAGEAVKAAGIHPN